MPGRTQWAVIGALACTAESPPPSPAVLPATMQAETLALLSLKLIPPPRIVAVLSTIVQPRIVGSPR